MQQQIFTKDFIFERIKDSNAPYWNLSLCQGFKNTANVMNYNGVDFEDEDSDATKIEKSIAQLARTISTFPPDSVFMIELRGAMTSNRSGIFGPFQFSNSDKPAQPAPATPNTQPLGAAMPPQGYIPETVLKGIQESLQSDFDKKLELFKQQTEQQRREDDFARRCQQLDEREKDLKDKEKEYNSSVAKAADVLIEIGKKIGAYFLMPRDQAAQMTTAQPQLGTTQHEPRSQEDVEKEDAVDDFSAFLYDNFTAEDIRQLKANIINYSKTVKDGSDKRMADSGSDGKVSVGNA